MTPPANYMGLESSLHLGIVSLLLDRFLMLFSFISFCSLPQSVWFPYFKNRDDVFSTIVPFHGNKPLLFQGLKGPLTCHPASTDLLGQILNTNLEGGGFLETSEVPEYGPDRQGSTTKLHGLLKPCQWDRAPQKGTVDAWCTCPLLRGLMICLRIV